MAQKSDLGSREMESYVDTGKTKSVEITLSATEEAVTTVTLPSNAKGIRLFPSSDIRFAVNATVVAVGTSSSQTVAASAFTVGGIAKSSTWETRLLPSTIKTKSTDTERTISLSSLVASVVVVIEVF